MEGRNDFHRRLKLLMDEYVNKVYDCTEHFPKTEIFGITSQFRRSSLSVILNYIESYARRRNKVLLNFLETSYGSLKESKYIVYFSFKRKYLGKKEYKELLSLAEEIGAMLWGTINKLQ